VMCVMKLLSAGSTEGYIFTYVVVNVLSSVVSTINYLLIRIN